jgi:hypothetical protein
MSDAENKTNPAVSMTPGSVKFFNKKTPGFRIVQADGAWGALNAAGIIHMQFFSEHPGLPNAVNFIASADGKKFEKITLDSGEEQHRDFEVDVAMTLSAAKLVHVVLGNFIKMAEDHVKAQIEARK